MTTAPLTIDPAAAVIVVTFPMPAGLVFDWHTHDDHQLAWAASGVLTVRTEASAWVLPPTRALWIPAGLPHETLSAGAATMRSAYRPAAPVPGQLAGADAGRGQPAAVRADRLPRESRPDARTSGRTPRRCSLDLLQPVAMTTIEVRWPADDRGRKVADGLAAAPADGRTLAEWGHEVGASERTLARAFLTGTGLSFGRWRTLLRVQAALRLLAAGEPVGNVARRVGYDSDSAFVQAFRRETGLTPVPTSAPAERPGYGRAEQAKCPFLLKVECTGGRRLNPADAPAELGNVGPNPRVGEDAEAEGQRDRADVVPALDRQPQRDCGQVSVAELAVRGIRWPAPAACSGRAGDGPRAAAQAAGRATPGTGASGASARAAGRLR